MKPMHRGWIAVITCLIGAPALAGEASGSFRVDGKDPGVIAPTQAAALDVRDSYNPRHRVIEIILSSAPVDAEAALAALNPHSHVINQPALMANDYVLMWLMPDGTLQMNATFRQTMTQYLEKSGSMLQVKMDVNTPERVAGHVKSLQPTTTLFGDRYSVDLKFDTAVSHPPPGQTLKKGGEEPGKALRAFLASARKKNWPAIKAAASPAALRFFEADYRTPKENAEETLSALQMWLPKSGLKVTGGQVRGDLADLDIEGDMFPGSKGFYVARMRKVGKQWLFEGSTLLGMLP